MRILVAGATGALGRRLVPILVSGGHSVIGLTHTPAKTEMLRALGAEPALADGLDAKAIHTLVAGTKPDVIVHEVTDLKGSLDLRKFDRAFATSNRMRIEGPLTCSPPRGTGRGRAADGRAELLRLALCTDGFTGEIRSRRARSRSTGRIPPHA